MQSSQEAVISTNDDATQCKRQAVALGYWQDPYINQMSKPSSRRAPEINRGYYARTFAVRRLVQNYIQVHSQRCQIVSFGCGFDTLFWNLNDDGATPLKYVDVDFPMVTRQKLRYILTKKDSLAAALGNDVEISSDRTALKSNAYNLVPADVTDTQVLHSKLQDVGVDFRIPTLILSECVLMYIASDATHKLLSYLSTSFADARYVNYDVVNMNDKFAEVMLSNLGSRHCTLHVKDCMSSDTQIQRFRVAGWGVCDVLSMTDVYYKHIPQVERLRVEKLEMLDEVHLLRDLLDHYCICLASNTKELNLHISDGHH